MDRDLVPFCRGRGAKKHTWTAPIVVGGPAGRRGGPGRRHPTSKLVRAIARTVAGEIHHRRFAPVCPAVPQCTGGVLRRQGRCIHAGIAANFRGHWARSSPRPRWCGGDCRISGRITSSTQATCITHTKENFLRQPMIPVAPLHRNSKDVSASVDDQMQVSPISSV